MGPTGLSSVSIDLADGLRLPVISVASMMARLVTGQQLLAAVSNSGPDRLFEVVWSSATDCLGAGSEEAPLYELFESVEKKKIR